MHESWKPFLKSEFEKPYFKELSEFLHAEYDTKTIFPPKQLVFSAFATDLNEVKVVILGQDPYHTPGAAEGLAFSVPRSQPIPPSLINIYKEIDSDIGRHTNTSGSLRSWQKQGVLLLNTVLTVEAHKPKSHSGKGWEIFTTEVIKYLNDTRPHLVFILWGRDARNKKSLIDSNKHLILESPHPSPLSAHAGFFGNHHFSKTNEFLKSNNLKEIVW
ncbi:MAG: uracil-DNA glycosylase [Candidatus Saccharimonadaceae bacterium]|nr:uracil-DNA glycosylase [Candidatus Saccharimonadaceae bacterium]